MRVFVTILEGTSPGEAQPILATEDEHVVRGVARLVQQRLARAAGTENDSAGKYRPTATDTEDVR